MIELKEIDNRIKPAILVIGIGGGGNNAVDRMIESGIDRVTFAAVNTDRAVLDDTKAEIKIPIGEKMLKGYGAGADPTLGAAAAKENEDEISELISGYDMVITTCGMGGGTGTGAIPVISKLSKDRGILTVGVVTMPFSFENTPRMVAAKNGIEKLKENVDTLLVIHNDKLLSLSDKPLMLDDAFQFADSVLKYTIEGITNIVFNKGIVNIDFNDISTTLRNKGAGHLGIGRVDEGGSIIDAVKLAINSPLLNTSIKGAENLLINTSGKVDVLALNEAILYIKELAGENVNIIWGTVKDQNQAENGIVVTVIATGMPSEKKVVAQESMRIKPEVHFSTLPVQPVQLNRPVEYPKPSSRATELEIPPFLKDFHK